MIDVDGAGPEMSQPVWDWLLSQPNRGSPATLVPASNFHNYLIGRDGKLVAHDVCATWPGDDPNDPNDSFESSEIVKGLEAELAKPAP